MKRLAVIAVAISAMLTGCGVPAESSGAGGSGNAERKTAGIGDKVRDGKFQFTVTKVTTKASVGDGALAEDAQGVFKLVHVTVKNIGDEARTFDSGSQTAKDAEGREFDADTGAAIYLGDSNSFMNDINPGNKVKGIVIFDVPKGTKLTEVELHDSLFSDGVTVSL